MKHKLTRITALALAVIMSFSMLLVPVQAASFTDVPEKAWYKAAVDYVSEKGWMNGVGEMTFAPTMDVTRAMFVTLLAAYADEDVDNNSAAFTDTGAGKWYTGSAAWAAGLEIVKGIGDGRFAPNRAITRQDLCVMLYKYLHVAGIELKADADRTYADFAGVSAYAKEAVSFCAASGLVIGFEDSTFRPKNTATRAQVAQILMRLDQLRQGQELPEDPMPAQSFNGEAGEAMNVSVEAPEGALPEGTGMALAPVTDEASLEILAAKAQSRVFAAADISFIKDGEEIEPNAAVEVQISLDNLQNIENPTVVHINKSGNVEAVSGVEMVSTNRAGTEKALRFYAKDFSVYAVIGDGETGDNARLTVEFYDSTRTGAAPVKSYTVTKHDIVTVDGSKSIESVVPDPAVSQTQNNMTFCGWTTNDDYTADDLLNTDGTYKDCSLDRVRADIITLLESGTVKEGDTYKVYAMYFYNFVVTYLNETGSTIVKSDSIYTKQSQMDYTIYAPYSAENNGYAFRGWTVVGSSANTVYQNFDEVQVDKDVSLKAYVRMGKWITFYEKTNDSDEYKGATYTPPKFILDSELKTTDKPANPTLPGYTFVDWYVKGTNTPFSFSNRTLDRNYDLEAHWTRNTTANYTVLFWIQNLDGTGYNFDHSQIVKNAAVDGNTSVVKQGTGNNTYVTVDGVETKLNGFKVKESGGIETAIVKPDGTTVVNVYFDRNEYTLTFTAESGTPVKVSGTVSNDDLSNDNYYVRVKISETYHYWKVHQIASSYTYSEVPRATFDTLSVISSDSPFYTTDSDGYYVLVQGYNSAWWVYDTDGYRDHRLTSDEEIYYVTSNSSTTYYIANYATVYEVTRLFGADVSDIFPIVGTNGVTYNNGERWKPINSSVWNLVMVYVDTMPDENVTFRVDVANRPLKTMNYYVEALPSDTNTVTFGGKKYVLYTKEPIKARYNGVSAEDFVELTGFTKDKAVNASGTTLTLFHPSGISGSDMYYEWDTSNDATINFLYNRNTYSILYQDGMYYSHSKDNSTGENQILGRDKVDYRTYINEEDNILYQDDITSYDVGGANYYIPTLTGFDFQGWYLDSACQNPATTTTLAKMPLDGVVLYAKWQQRAIRVVLDANGGTLPSGQASNFKIDEYEDISEGQEIKTTRDGYEFVGWYQDPHFVTPFNFATKLYYNAGDDESTADAYSDADRAAYGDSARPFVVGIRKLYAKWRKDLPGANGLTVIYKADDLNNPSTGTGTFSSDYDGSDNKTSTDKKPYQDGTEAIGRAASDPESGKRFLYWEYTNQAGETVHVYPGKPFTLNAEDAVVSDVNSQSLVGGTASVNPAAALNRSIGGENRPLAAEEATTLASWDFEDNSLTGWTRFDSDGDGYQFAITANPDDGTVSHGGTYYLRSDSYINTSSTSGKALTPNNWICTPAVNLPADGTNTISFWAKGVDASYASEVISVYVTTNISTTGRIVSNGTLLEKITLTGEYKQYSYTIPSSYSGNVYIVLRHHDVTDMFALAVDDMEVVNTPEQASTGDEVYWEPTEDIVDNEEYLIGYVDANGDTWLVMNYNPDTSTSYQTLKFGTYSYSSRCAYAIKAIKDANTSAGNVTGVDTSSVSNATMDNVVFTFSPNNNGRLIYHDSKYLSIDSPTSGIATNTLSFYPDAYQSNYDQLYHFNYANHKLTITVTTSSGTSVTKTVYCVTNSSTGTVSGFGAYSGDPGTTSTIQLYRKVIVHNETKYTVRFYGWNGALIDTQEVAEYGAANAPAESELGMPAGYTFTGWNPTGFDYVTEDMDVYAQFETQSGTTVYTVTFVDKNYNVLKTETVEEGGSATAPAAPAPETGYHFVGWDVDFTNVQSNLVVVPVYEKNVTKQYAITLHAVYAPIEPQKKTHVTWYANNGTDDMDDSDDVFINEGFAIETFEMFKDGTNAELEYPGYTFLGWARLPERPEHVNTYAPEKLRDPSMYETYEDNGTTKIKSYYGLNEEDLWLVYHPADENHTEAYFTVKNETGMPNGTEVTQIAPNEKMPYHGLYAVWRAKSFYVFHSATGKLEAYSYPDATRNNSTFNLVDKVTDGYLYGGYYTSYGGLNTVTLDGNTRTIADVVAAQFDSKGNAYAIDSSTSIAWSQSYSSGAAPAVAELGADGVKAQTGFEAYTGASMKIADNSRRFWTRSNAYGYGDQADADRGDSLKPEVGTVYYLKEVPESYLTTKLAWTYDLKNSNKLIDLFEITAVDDSYYSRIGFRNADGENQAAAYGLGAADIAEKEVLTKKLVLVQGDKGQVEIGLDLLGVNGGYVAVRNLYKDSVPAVTQTVLPTWETYDHVVVSNYAVCYNVNEAQDTVTVSTFEPFQGNEKLYINFNNCYAGSDPWILQTNGNWTWSRVVFKKYGSDDFQCVDCSMDYSTKLGTVTIPAGSWDYLIIVRYAPMSDHSYEDPFSGNWGQTANIPLSRTQNYIMHFVDNDPNVSWGTYTLPAENP